MDVHPDIHGFVDEDLLAAADVNIAVDNVQDAAVDVDLLADVDVVLAVDDDTAAVDHAQVDEDLLADVCINLTKPSKPIQTRPKTSNKFGRGKRRGGDRKTTGTIDPILASQAADEGGVAHHHPPTIAKKSTKKQLIRSFNKSEKKRQMTEDKMVVVTKKKTPPPMIARLWQCWLKNEEGRATWLFNMPIASSPVCVIR
jgi:hypothetical protein